MRAILSALVLALALAVTPACGGGPDKFDAASLKEGASHTAKLKFWMLERGVVGDTMVDNIHFDDSASTRVVFLFDAALKPKLEKLEQGKTYKVTFTYKGGDKLYKGTVTAVE